MTVAVLRVILLMVVVGSAFRQSCGWVRLCLPPLPPLLCGVIGNADFGMRNFVMRAVLIVCCVIVLMLTLILPRHRSVGNGTSAVDNFTVTRKHEDSCCWSGAAAVNISQLRFCSWNTVLSVYQHV
jgi:hypothetical protein